jgi:pimeloyl-ACP methyl ester carboxylesterase
MGDNASDAAGSGEHDYLNYILVGSKKGVTWLNGGHLDVIMRAPLPGIVIFVHGVNSDGEWYQAAEEGLCAGLNERLKRRDEHMAYPTPEGGQLTPATYMKELTPDGFINPDMKFNTFITGDEHFTPVIHFRWGYKANAKELQDFGEGIYLNEQNYWGGGPFANGCSALPDLWTQGLSANLLLWMHIEHLNPTNERIAFSCPPRPYFVLAALRLAKLIESIRKLQADVPVTIVCHSQGNMVSMAAAFLGDAMPPVQDGIKLAGRCVADSYVLCNPPYSLATSNFTEDWSAGDSKDREGGTGRQTYEARVGTFRAFLDIVRQPASRRQKDDDINVFMRNENHGFNMPDDRNRYGYGLPLSTLGRVTLYCNPHDQVISSTAVVGIGWRGMSKDEIEAVGGRDVFCQRVFAQGYQVGVKGSYHYWNDHYAKPKPGSQKFWWPESPKAQYSVPKGLEVHRGRKVGQILTVAFAPAIIFLMEVLGLRINALPDHNWAIPLDAPDPPEPFKPQAAHFGPPTDDFDQGYDATGQHRDQNRARDEHEPYTGDRPILHEKGGEVTDAAMGDEDSEASMRYEDHARLRMQARREGLVKKGEKQVVAEDEPEKASAAYTAWHNEKIKTYLADTVNAHATDHSTILSNPMHAQKALAYDVAVGLCHIRDEDLHRLRIAADWRFLNGLDNSDSSKAFSEYFLSGRFNDHSVFEWAHDKSSEGRMPAKIVDLREHPLQNENAQERLARGEIP